MDCEVKDGLLMFVLKQGEQDNGPSLSYILGRVSDMNGHSCSKLIATVKWATIKIE
jgi:hypothetical protein